MTYALVLLLKQTFLHFELPDVLQPLETPPPTCLGNSNKFPGQHSAICSSCGPLLTGF